jgi:Integrase core domain
VANRSARCALVVRTAWQQALQTRGFGPGQGLQLYHSDRGSQYASALFQRQLEQAGTECSMSEGGQCLGNAVAESFFGTFEAELLADQPQGRFSSKAQARALTADYIQKFYNTVRLHAMLDYKSPIAFELAHRQNRRKEIQMNLPAASCEVSSGLLRPESRKAYAQQAAGNAPKRKFMKFSFCSWGQCLEQLSRHDAWKE